MGARQPPHALCSCRSTGREAALASLYQVAESYSRVGLILVAGLSGLRIVSTAR